MSWETATKKVKEIANGLPIYWGSGSPIYEPHVVARTKDAWSGEGMGYNVRVAPRGDNFKTKYEFYSVSV